jgi:Lyase/outer membrane porin, OprD family/Anaerobic c4-dicarboxylate membrane transporter
VPRRVPRLGHDDREEVKRIAGVRRLLQSVNLGATAIGTTVTAAPGYPALAVKHLSAIIGIEFGLAEDLIEATSDTGDYVLLSGVLKHTSANLTKICNDIRMLASGPRCGLNELNLPQMQPGSSITPGKVNPVIPEVVNQTGFLVIGLDLTVTLAASAGQLQLNVMEPVITFALFASIATMERAVTSLRVNCVQGITANAERTRDTVLNSLGIVTLKPSLGYKPCAEIVHEGHVTSKSLHDIVVKERQLLTQQKWDEVFFLGKDLKDDPEYQARLASGAIPPPKAAADRPPLKPGATLSAVLFLIAVTLILTALSLTPGANLAISAGNYYALDVFNTAFAKAEYTHPISEDLKLQFGLQYTDQRSVGEALVGDFATWNVGAGIRVVWRGLTLATAAHFTGADASISSPWGTWPGYLSMIVTDFDRANEKAFGVGLRYDFGGSLLPFRIPGLTVYLAYVQGNDQIDPTTGRAQPTTREGDLDIIYNVPGVKGLSLRFRNGYVSRGSPTLLKDFRIIVNYELDLL